MESKKLTLGSLVLNNQGDECEVMNLFWGITKETNIHLKDKIGNWMWCGLDDIYGIPITESILLKCGFTNEIEEEIPDNSEFLCFFKDNIDVELVPDKIGGFKVEGITLYEDIIDEDGKLGAQGCYTIKSDIKYLHQLQNLYWCLTGTELEVNL